MKRGRVQGRRGIRTLRPGCVATGAQSEGNNSLRGNRREGGFDKSSDLRSPEMGGGDVIEARYMSKRRLTLLNGAYVASNVSTLRAWNCKVGSLGDMDAVIGPSGCVRHLRELLPSKCGGSGGCGGCCSGGCGSGTCGGGGGCGCGCGCGVAFKGCQMYWMTDRTPHEQIPLQSGTYIQQFQLVTNKVDEWYLDEWTRNPLGVKPGVGETKRYKNSHKLHLNNKQRGRRNKKITMRK